MRSRGEVTGALLSMLLLGQAAPSGAVPGSERKAAVKLARCRSAVIEGEVQAGQSLRRSFAGGLDVLLEPIASGWVLRVIPTRGDRPREDFAEIATPPYRSVSPLLLSTDFSFRSQDAVGWNPRRFRYVAEARAFARLEAVYRKVVGAPRAAAEDEAALGRLVGEQPEGELRILDASLLPGTADPTRAAALVSTHFAETAHRIEQPSAGRTTPLGRLNWVRVRVRLELARGARVMPGVDVVSSVCGGS